MIKIVDGVMEPEGDTLEVVCIVNREEVRKCAVDEEALPEQLKRLFQEEWARKLMGALVKGLIGEANPTTSGPEQWSLKVEDPKLGKLLEKGIAIEMRRSRNGRVVAIGKLRLSKQGLIEESK